MKPLIKKMIHNVFLAKWEQSKKKHPMKWLEIEITRRCQLSCIHCGSSCSLDSPYANELSAKEIIDMFKRVAEVYDPKKIKVAITGGEPLVRKDVFHIIANITELGFRASVVTNGYIMNEDIIKLLAASGIKSLSISLDGLEKNHNWLRNRKDAYQKAVGALKMTVDSGLFYVEPITTVNKRNIRELEEIERLLEDIGVHSWRLGKTFPIGRAKQIPELYIDNKEFQYLMEFISARFNDKKRRMPVMYCEEGYLGNYELEVRDYFFHCPAGVNICAVLADGSLTGCAAVPLEFIQGNIKTDDIIEVWENRFQPFRDRSWMKKGVCKDCEVYDYCRGDGFHLWKKGALNPAKCNYELLTKAVDK